MPMSRRSFIRAAAASSGSFLIPGFLQACGNGTSEALRPWIGPESQERDVRRIVLSYAALAANPHNTQPWLVDLRGDLAFDLTVDPERLLPRSDPPFRQTHIGQGTFLENAHLAAGALGYRAEIEYFPHGMYGDTELEAKPVARVQMVEDPTVERDPLFEMLAMRSTNKRAYEGPPLTPAELRALEHAYDTKDFPLALVIEPTRLQDLAGLMLRGMAAEVASNERNLETLEWFRFDDREIERHRDGFGLASSGISGPVKWIAENLVLSRDRSVANPGRFASETVKLAARQANSTLAFGCVCSRGNSRLDQVLTGRAYERLNLTATALGLAIQPMSQTLQEYPEARELRNELIEIARLPDGHTPQLPFRLGRARPVTHTPRRSIDDLIRS